LSNQTSQQANNPIKTPNRITSVRDIGFVQGYLQHITPNSASLSYGYG